MRGYIEFELDTVKRVTGLFKQGYALYGNEGNVIIGSFNNVYIKDTYYDIMLFWNKEDKTGYLFKCNKITNIFERIEIIHFNIRISW